MNIALELLSILPIFGCIGGIVEEKVEINLQRSREECKVANTTYQHAHSLSSNPLEIYLLCSHMDALDVACTLHYKGGWVNSD